MTDEEKVREIIRISNTNQVYDVVDFNALHESLYEDLMEMAEWKDKQFEDTKDETKVDIRRELAWEIREKIHNGASLIELDIFVRNICKL